MHEIDWDVLLTAIEKRTCILFLGPDAYPLADKQSVEAAMWAHTTQDAKLIRKFYADEGLVLLQRKAHRRSFVEKVKHFYKDQSLDWTMLNAQLSKLVHIPFSTIVNLTFDNLLSQRFDAAELDYKELIYIFRPSKEESQELVFDNNKTAILNLLGSLNTSDNLVLEHEDLFAFLKNLFADKDLSFKEQLLKADCFLFVGVPFDKWYMQLLLQLIGEFTKSKPMDKVDRYALAEHSAVKKQAQDVDMPLKEVKMKDLFSHELKIMFVEDHPEAVIDALYAFSQEKGVINKRIEGFGFYKNNVFKQIHFDLLRDDIGKALARAIEWGNQQSSNDKDVINELTMFSARYNRLERDKDTTTSENYKIERNKIIKGLLELMGKKDE
jgi:hypothetical protein